MYACFCCCSRALLSHALLALALALPSPLASLHHLSASGRQCELFRNKRDQWVVYDGKTEAEVDAEWAGGSEENAIDLSAEMDEARTIAEALCAPAALS